LVQRDAWNEFRPPGSDLLKYENLKRAIILTWNDICNLKKIKKKNFTIINCLDGREAWNECRPPGCDDLKYENLTKRNKSYLK
jgi:hypothetical protein